MVCSDDENGGIASDSLDLLRMVAQTPDVEPEDLSGSQLAHFRVVGKLGRGGMGVVYEAEDTKLERKVALKVLPPEVLHDEERRVRFLREAKAAAAVTHANLATVYDVGQSDGRVFIAMELVRGTRLRDAFESLSAERAVAITKEVLRGLRKAHAAGIVHRDLKPDNVMLTEDDEVKVLDFGLAKFRRPHADDDEGDSVSTAEGRMLGTPGYMSPEQASGKEVDPRTDLFAVGVMLYEMLAGTRPFGGDSAMDVIVATTRDAPTPLRDHVPSVSRALETTVMHALEKEPSARFASAQAFLDALDDDTATAEPSAPWLYVTAAGAVVTVVALGWWANQRTVEERDLPSTRASTTATARARTRVAPPPGASTSPPAPVSSPAPSPSDEPSARPAPPPPPLPRTTKKRKVNLGI